MAIVIPAEEYVLTTTRSSGPGGQHVNKVETAVQLRFDIQASSLPEEIKSRLLAKRDKRITKDGVVVILAQRSRSQLKNREDAVKRLHALIELVSKPPKKRKRTKPSRAAKIARLAAKKQRSEIKQMRKKVDPQ